MFILPLLLLILPLGLDTLGVSISLGMKSRQQEFVVGDEIRLPTWLITAILFSVAEAFMPILGLAIGYATSLVLSDFMHIAGPLILIGFGFWELLKECLEYYKKNQGVAKHTLQAKVTNDDRFEWKRQLLLALSISLDELAIGFSLGSVPESHGSIGIRPVVLCILIGIQSFLMTFIGILLGRILRMRMKNLKDMTEFLSAFLLIGIGTWLLVA